MSKLDKKEAFTMQRDMELIRSILFEIEKSEDDPRSWKFIELPEIPQVQISYHIDLLHQAGLVRATDLSSSDGYEWAVSEITWNGHEFLDSIRNESVWKQMKEKLDISSLPLSVLSGVAVELTKEYAKQRFGLGN